nr:hypothetical protein [Treponema socranskii]
MYATTGIIQGNTVLTNDYSLERYNGRKVIITVLEDEKPFNTVSAEKLFALSDSLISQNMESYKELAR